MPLRMDVLEEIKLKDRRAESIIEELKGEACKISDSSELTCPLLSKVSRLLVEDESAIGWNRFSEPPLHCGDLTCPCRIKR